MDKKRGRLEIIRDILLIISEKKKVKPTKLLHSSNLSPQMFKEYKELLIEKDFIVESKEDNKRFFVMKDKGQEFLDEYRNIEQTINSFGL